MGADRVYIKSERVPEINYIGLCYGYGVMDLMIDGVTENKTGALNFIGGSLLERE